MTSAPARSETCGYADRAEFYDLEYPETRDHAFLIGLVKTHSEAIMILPGGTGATALALHKAYPNLALHSVDIEPAMVAEAERRFSALTIGRVVSHWGDMTNLQFDMRFNRICVAREAFQMLPNDGAALACLLSMKRHLAEAGEIVLDLANFDAPADASDLKYFDAQREPGIRYLDCRHAIGNKLLTRHVVQHIDNEGARCFHFDYLIESAADDESRQFSACLNLRRFQLSEIEALIASANLHVHALYGDYELSRFTPNSPRLCFILG